MHPSSCTHPVLSLSRAWHNRACTAASPLPAPPRPHRAQRLPTGQRRRCRALRGPAAGWEAAQERAAGRQGAGQAGGARAGQARSPRPAAAARWSASTAPARRPATAPGRPGRPARRPAAPTRGRRPPAACWPARAAARGGALSARRRHSAAPAEQGGARAGAACPARGRRRPCMEQQVGRPRRSRWLHAAAGWRAACSLGRGGSSAQPASARTAEPEVGPPPAALP